MAVLLIAIRNERGQALTSIDGIPFSVAVQQGRVSATQQTVDLIYASIMVVDVAPGSYLAIATHILVEPISAAFQFEVVSETELLLILFIYLEAERVLLDIQMSSEL